MDIAALPGFRDFYPEDLALREHIFAVWRSVATRYGCVEYDGPPLEPLELYTRKSGEEIVAQLYRFVDRGGREVALRPEMTPTFARMVAARAGGLPKPIRWFSIPQLFRYERPQKGRLREHFQLNLDIVGEPGEVADAEVVAAAVDVLREFGLSETDFVARLSDRQLVGGILTELGVPEEKHTSAFAVLDRAERETEEWVLERLADLEVEGERAQSVLALGGMGVEEVVDAFGRRGVVRERAERLRSVFEYLDAAGFTPYVEFDAKLVRGLAYYTGIVFELWDRRGRFRAICGGGRYDDLLRSLGGPDLPALGFGMGDVVLTELLRDRGLVPAPRAGVDDYIVCVRSEERATVLRIVHELRAAGRRVVYDFGGRSVGRQFKAADQAGAERAIVVGPEEVASGVVRIRNMRSGEERVVSLDQLLGE